MRPVLTSIAYGGVTAFQDSSATLNSDAPVNPNSLTADEASKIGDDGGIQAGYTWKDLMRIRRPCSLPALDTDFFWDGFEYRDRFNDPGFRGQLGMISNVNTYSFMLEPKLKFNLGNFRPYVGFGVGGTYIHADGSSANLMSSIGTLKPEFFPSRSTPARFPSRGWPDWNISLIPIGP